MKNLLVICALLIGHFSFAQSANVNGTGTAPDFNVTDIYGGNHQLYNYLDSGQIVIVEFISVYCPACQYHASPVENVWSTYGDSGTAQIQLLALEINVNSDSSNLQTYIDNYNVTYPVVNDVNAYSLGYPINYLPTFYVIYPDRSYETVCTNCNYPTTPSTIESTLGNLINAWTPPVENLIISEYAEGTSYNKYIELYNGTAYEVDLADYELWKITNGGSWYEQSLSLSGAIASGGTYVIAHGSADTAITNLADTLSSICSFNGDDAIGLAHMDSNGVFQLIDAVGDSGVAPSTAWSVMGAQGSTQDHSLIRHASVCNPNTNWTTSFNNEWEVFPQDDWSNIGQHTGCLNTLPSIAGCTDSTATNYEALATQDDGSCVYPNLSIIFPNNNFLSPYPEVVVEYMVQNFQIGTAGNGADGHLHYSLNGSMTMQYNNAPVILSNLSNGSYVLVLELVDNNHQSLSPVISDTLVFSVLQTVVGCTDSLALNYDATATQEDGSCAYLCPSVNGLQLESTVTNVPEGSRVKFSWENLYEADEYRIRYKKPSTAVWNELTIGGLTTVPTGQASKYLYNLEEGEEYELQMRKHCVSTNAYSDWSSLSFNTPSSCPEVVNLSASHVEDEWLTLSWDSAGLEQGQTIHWYLVRFSEDGGNSWLYKDAGVNTSVRLGGRTPESSLIWQVKSYCNNDNYYRSAWVEDSVEMSAKPAMPQNLSSNAVTQFSKRQFMWDAPAGPMPHHYIIALSSDQWSSIVYRGSHDATKPSFIDGAETARVFGNLQAGTAYEWKMRAFHTTGVLYYGAALGLTWKSDWTSPQAFTTSSSARIALDVELKVYPNPTKGVIYFSSAVNTNGLEVYNVLGEKVYVQQAKATSIDLSDLPKGVYYLNLEGYPKKELILQ